MSGIIGLTRERGRLAELRLLNAIALMDTYPSTHLFVPGIVELYTGLGVARENIASQAPIYSELVKLTRGRLLPFIGFDPLREAEYRVCGSTGQCRVAMQGGSLWPQLEYVKKAILEQGFVG
jgi:hypothetical protein